MRSCTVPTIPYDLDERGELGEWRMLHKYHTDCAANKDPNVVLIGASIIQFIEHCPIWNEKFEPLNSLNFGISGDRIENVLWRVKDGVLNNVKPKVCIVNCGSNNLGSNTPYEIMEGLLTLVQEIRSYLPDCYIIIIGVLPRGRYPDNLRRLISQINVMLGVKVKNMPKVELYEPDILQADGTLLQEDAPDFLHPSDIGYQKIFDPIFPKINEIINSQQ